MLLSLMLIMVSAACAPKTPPAGSVELTAPAAPAVPAAPAALAPPFVLPAIPVKSGPMPLAFGMLWPWDGEPTTEAQRAFVDAEAVIKDMTRGLGEVTTLTEALAYTDEAEDVRRMLQVASTEVALEGPATVRMGDALRVAAFACGTVSEGTDAAAGEEACAPLVDAAAESYTLGLSLTEAKSAWNNHALWAIAVLEGSVSP